MISLRPKPSPEYRREVGAHQPGPCPPQGVITAQREREQAEVCVRKGQTDQDTGTNAAAYKQEHHQACSQATPVGLSTGTTQARGRDKYWGGRGVSAFHHPVTSRRDTDRRTGQRHRIKAWDLLMGPGMPITACFDGTKKDHCLCRWGAGKGVGQWTEERLEGQGSASRLGQPNPGPGQSR